MTVFTLVCDGREQQVDVDVESGRQTVAVGDLEAATGWRLEDRGLCRGDVCVPAPAGELLVDGRVDLAAAAAAMHRPWVSEPAVGVGVLGEPAASRAAALMSLEAPDFALPDLDGTPPGEAAVRTCRSGRHCTTSSGRTG